jgi:hypothetical protein
MIKRLRKIQKQISDLKDEYFLLWKDLPDPQKQRSGLLVCIYDKEKNIKRNAVAMEGNICIERIAEILFAFKSQIKNLPKTEKQLIADIKKDLEIQNL